MRTLIVITECSFSKEVSLDYALRSRVAHEITQFAHGMLRLSDEDVDVRTATAEPQSVDQFLATHAPPEPDEDDLKTRTRALVRTLKDNESRFDWPAGIVGFMVQCMDAELRPPGGWGAEQGSQREIGENAKFTPEEEEDGETKIMRMVIMREPVGDAHDRLPPGLPVEEVPGELLSASIGGNEEIGYYLNFRGTPDDVVKMLDRVSATASVALPQGLYEDRT